MRLEQTGPGPVQSPLQLSSVIDAAPRKGMIGDIHQLRGIAILGVVLVHAIATYLNVPRPPVAADGAIWYASIVNEVLFHDFTVLFTFISGVLFSALPRRGGWRSYYEKKIKYVLLPYLFMSVLFTLIGWTVEDGLIVLRPDMMAYVSMLSQNLLLGAAQGPYWYIPVVFFLFLVTPVLIQAIEHPKGAWFVAGMALMPLVMSRTGIRLTVEIFGYFLGVYTVGLFWGKNHETYVQRLRLYVPHLAVIVGAATAVLVALKIHGINLIRPVLIQESVFYIQKMALTSLLLVLLQRELKIPFLNQLATYSFTVYFLHVILLEGLLHLWHATGLALGASVAGVLSAAIFVICVVAASLGVSWAFHARLGRRARFLVG